MERKLAAIMAMDIVGFAGMMAADEVATIDRLHRLRREVIDLQVGAHRGRVFKAMGDGFLAEFSSTLEAVNCAKGIQQAMALQQAETDSALLLRIGVALGDVVLEGNDLIGEGVNNAARLEAMAEPGGIAVSDAVMSQIRGKVDLPLVDAGHKRLKASDAPLHVYMTRARPGQSGSFFDFDQDALAASLITGGCLCGEVRCEIHAPAISSGYCHCRICQKFSGSAMSVWTAFPESAVKFVAGQPRYFSTSPIAERGFCPTCGSSISYRLVRPEPAAYLVIFTSILDDPGAYAPTAHNGMESRLPFVEMADDLPRTRSEESRVLQHAWASVGLPDPATWGAGARKPDVF